MAAELLLFAPPSQTAARPPVRRQPVRSPCSPCVLAPLTAFAEAGTSAADALAYDIGRDHARHGITPPPEPLASSSALRRGYESGRAAFAGRTRAATPNVRLWLQLRLQAWLRGRSFETLCVTPNYLGQLEASHCPVTRQPLSQGRQLPPHGAPQDRVVSRLCDDAGYAAGHLAMLSLAADLAKADHGWEDAWAQADQLQRSGAAQADGLNAGAWRRLAVLMSFVTPLPHAQAAGLPLLVLPPNRVHLLNPVQGLQVLATQLLSRSGWSARLAQLLPLLPHDAARQAFHHFFLALLPRVIASGHPTDPLRRRWALEDAWRHTEVLQRWRKFALLLDALACQLLLERIAQRGLLPQRLQLHSSEQDTAGWELESRGYLGSSSLVEHAAALTLASRGAAAVQPAIPRTLRPLPVPQRRMAAQPQMHLPL
ncbi:MAG: hypothetical protein IPG57_25530 [Burkholderiales bacterium]|nr:hypothetical protein [Burkholderiales bacterium]